MNFSFKKIPFYISYSFRRGLYLFISLLLRTVLYFTCTRKEKIFFMLPNYQMRSGGILSIYGLYQETKKMQKNADVFLLAGPSNSYSFKQRWFRNKGTIYNLLSLKDQIRKAEKVTIHIPEMYLVDNLGTLSAIQKIRTGKVHANVLNQNNAMMPAIEHFDRLKSMFDETTITVNFRADLTTANREKWKVSHHYLPSWLPGTNYSVVPYEQKKNLLVVSDDHPLKAAIIDKIQKRFGVSVFNVKKVKFHHFLKAQKSAKWAISFGEGFDNIFGGGIAAGGVTFAVYSDFFPNSFPKDKFPNVFDSYEDMLEHIVDLMVSLDNKTDYEALNRQLQPYITAEFNYEMHLDALQKFYNKEYTIA